jgi:ATP-dependent Clp protease ATP-binding subunit ClpB
LRGKWTSEKEIVEAIQKCKQKLEEFQIQYQRAEREGQSGICFQNQVQDIPAQEAMLKAAEEKLTQLAPESRMTTQVVTAKDIAEVVARWTGIPLAKMMKGEKERLLHLEAEMHKRVIGQDEAVEAVSPMPFAATVPASATPTSPLAPLFSADQPAWVKQSLQRRWPMCCSMMKKRSPAST